MTLNAAFSQIWNSIGPHSLYWYKNPQISPVFEGIAARESETLLKRWKIGK